NSSYRYMIVLSEMLPIEARGGRALGADALTDTVRIDRPVAKLIRLELERVDAHGLPGGRDGRIAGFGFFRQKDARLLQVLDPRAGLAQIDRRAAQQFVAGENFHVTPP